MKNLFFNLIYFISYSFGTFGASIVILIGIDTIRLKGYLGTDSIVIIVVAVFVSVIGFITARFLPATQKKVLKILPLVVCGAYIIFSVAMLLFYEPSIGY